MNVLLEEWAGPDGHLGQYILEESGRSLDSYRAQPNLLEEHANEEQDTALGGYQHRQLFELVQNSADALRIDAGAEDGDYASRVVRGRVEVRLTSEYLYCADDGDPIAAHGVRALMFSRLSPKRGTGQIGTFGLGFKAVLGVSDAPEFFSRSGSFRFDRARSLERVRTVVSSAEVCPVLRLPEPIDPADCWGQDVVLRDLMAWAVNIVRLPLRRGARDDLRRQMGAFPAAFLLFVGHVGSLALIDDSGAVTRVLELERADDCYLLAEGDTTDEWRLFPGTHRLSDAARADRLPGDDRDEVPVWWAAPVGRLNRSGKFWAFFPTHTESLVPGILNAPWKTNSDRQNLLSGRYNDELIGASAALIANALPKIPTTEDPARHLDVLPSGRQAGDQANLLRQRLYTALKGRAIVPDQSGHLCRVEDISYPPEQLTPDREMVVAPFERWAAYPGRPDGWLHHKALTRTRRATVDRLSQDPRQPAWTWRTSRVPRATVAEWLEALVRRAGPTDAVAASMAAIQTAARIPSNIRTSTDLGRIVLTKSGGWREPDPQALFLPFESPVTDGSADAGSSVHPELATDKETLSALRQLGLKRPSPEGRFRAIAHRVLSGTRRKGFSGVPHKQLWKASRGLNPGVALAIIQEHHNWRGAVRVRTRAGLWQPLGHVLMPGVIVPGDGSRDDGVTVDCDFHDLDHDLLDGLGIADSPFVGSELGWDPLFRKYQGEQEKRYRSHDLPASPQAGYVGFTHYDKIGPLSVIRYLSEEAAAAYTDALLSLDACYRRWVMWHKGSNRQTYPKMYCESLPIWFLRSAGRVQTPAGVVPLADALGPHPANPAALHTLLQHQNADKIKAAFDLSDPAPEFFGEGDPTPLTDIWPGLREHLPAHRKNTHLVACQRIRVAGAERTCVFNAPYVYLAGSVEDDERNALGHVAEELHLGLRHHHVEAILKRRTPAEIEERCAAVRQCATDAERLLKAVGEDTLRMGLPPSLLNVLELADEPLTATEIAEAAIATYHTDALKEFKSALDHLGPPTKWAGSRRALTFVRSLGFSDEWAGERRRRRRAFEEIEGPQSLLKLHDYQRTVADNVREMLRANGAGGVERRGMISLPTGSGKTRVAVQAIVEAMRDDRFRGGVLWVADRDELCEQAVVEWAQVWRSEGTKAGRLRISRMWSGQPQPLATTEDHVVVATIQTLNLRLSRQATQYDFLKDFKLVVFDEAHRSIAPTFTTVMNEIGLTYRREKDEPLLIGLTATPYRRDDVDETARLARRYATTRLDSGAFADDDPQKVIQQLQFNRVLAQADQKVIEGGSFRVRPEEWEHVSRFVPGPRKQGLHLGWLPPTVADRIANNAERTRRILDAYKDHIEPDWPTLIFATSVQHAKTLAALLNRQGITARAVSGTTEPATRRRVIEAFRDGAIKALVNYGVFAEGFDAPKTRAIIVARPVNSPNLYFQMIGRGLRGPKNGGDERCLILNVLDNIEGFGHALAFSDLDWLWDR